MALKITYNDKSHVQPYGTREIQVWDLDMNEIKEVVNVNSDETAKNTTDIVALTSGYQGELLIADTPTADGYYLAGESGTYTNAGGLVIDLTEGVNYINVSGTQTVFTKTVIPVDTIPTGDIAEGETLSVSGGKINTAIQEIPTLQDSKNLANLDLTIDGFYINTLGAIKANAVSQYIKIPVSELTEYVIKSDGLTSNLVFTGLRFEDSNEVLISAEKIQLLLDDTTATGKKFTTPASTTSILFNTVIDPSFSGGYDTVVETLQVELGDTCTDYSPYSVKAIKINGYDISDEESKNRLDIYDEKEKITLLKQNRNIAILGDSITSGSNGLTWVDVLEDNEMFNNIYNVSKSGARWSHQASTIYDITLGSGNNVMWNQANLVIDSVTNLTQPKPNVWLIMAGRNDANFSVGDVDTIFDGSDILSQLPNTILEILEGVRYTCETILTEYPDAEIILVTPIQWYGVTNSLWNEQGDGIIEASRRLAVRSIDAGGECGIYNYFDTDLIHKYQLDGTHPNADGVDKLGNYMLYELKQRLNYLNIEL